MKKKDESGRVSQKKKPRAKGRPARPSRADIETLGVMLDLLRKPAPLEQVAPGTRLALALTRDERNLILHNWSVSGGLTDAQLKVVQETKEPELSMTLADWEELGGWVAGTGNHARSGSSLRSRADRFFDRIQELLDRYRDE